MEVLIRMIFYLALSLIAVCQAYWFEEDCITNSLQLGNCIHESINPCRMPAESRAVILGVVVQIVVYVTCFSRFSYIAPIKSFIFT